MYDERLDRNIFEPEFRQALRDLSAMMLRRDDIAFGPNMRHRNVPGGPLWMDAMTDPPPEPSPSGFHRFVLLRTNGIDDVQEWNAPEEVNGTILVRVIGGGASGAGGAPEENTGSDDHNGGGGGGGGGGASVDMWIRDVSPGEVFQYACGSGGSGASAEEDGNDGERSRFGFFADSFGGGLVPGEAAGGNGGHTSATSAAGDGGEGGGEVSLYTFDEDRTLTIESDGREYPARLIPLGGGPGHNGGPGTLKFSGLGGKGGASIIGINGSSSLGSYGAGSAGGQGEASAVSAASTDAGSDGVIIIWY